METAFASAVRKEPSFFPMDAVLARSWRRCRESGLVAADPPRRTPAGPAAATALADYGKPALTALADQVAGTATAVVLADPAGRIVAVEGPADFLAAAALQMGETWSEACRGSNAIGTCLVERLALAVAGPEHFLAACRGLAGVAAPIAGVGGDHLAGCLALYCPATAPLAHALALVQVHVGFIEDRLFDGAPAAVELRVHPLADAVDSPLSGRLAFAADGRLLARNGRCAPWLPAALAVDSHFEQGFAAPWAVPGDGATLVTLPTLEGKLLHARWLPRQPVSVAATDRAGSLADLGSDDPRLAEAARRAGRIVECDIPLLIQGETGSGKEWFAQAFHRSGSRRGGPFVAVNCAAIPATLIEAELFGYGEGAFTGARRLGSRGKIREADGGTLFLDEIGDMPLGLQAVLLRVLETRRVTPLGHDSDEAVDIRLVCASHQPLRELVEQGVFRADLFFRLSGMTIVLPPLRERSDFAAVVRRILAEESPGRPVRVDAEAFVLLRRYRWPGNLRQLRNVLRLGVALLGDEGVLLPAHLPAEIRAADAATADAGLRGVQVRLARESVDRHGGNISAAARELGITRTTLYRLLGGGGRGRLGAS